MAGTVRDTLERIPLAVRIGFYASALVAVILVGLPWLAYQLDAYVPAVHVRVNRSVRLLGWIQLSVFFGLYVRSSYYLMSRGRGAYIEFDPPRLFVADGPYRWVRNPIAACVVGMLVGEALAFSSTGILLLAGLAMLVAHVQVVLLEEPRLRRRFGPPYEEYLRRVPRWIPRRPRG